MLRILSRTAIRSAKFAPQKAVAPLAARSFFWDTKKDDDIEIKSKIRTDKEQQTGRRKEEMDAAEEGYDKFNNSSIVPPSDAGSWENPIEVPSGEVQRTVGYEDPFTHQMKWFNLNVGEVAFIPQINLYFKIKVLQNDGPASH